MYTSLVSLVDEALILHMVGQFGGITNDGYIQQKHRKSRDHLVQESDC